MQLIDISRILENLERPTELWDFFSEQPKNSTVSSAFCNKYILFSNCFTRIKYLYDVCVSHSFYTDDGIHVYWERQCPLVDSSFYFSARFRGGFTQSPFRPKLTIYIVILVILKISDHKCMNFWGEGPLPGRSAPPPFKNFWTRAVLRKCRIKPFWNNTKLSFIISTCMPHTIKEFQCFVHFWDNYSNAFSKLQICLYLFIDYKKKK
jgi:hypothetical protein